MREFYVKNAKGIIFDMNREDAFFSSPKGLGIARKTTYNRIGYSYVEETNILSQKKPYGNMVFDGYEQYDEFLDVIKYTPLTLMYKPLDTMYYMDVNTFTMEKTEISYKDASLTCKVTFEGKTPWYVEKTSIKQENTAEGKAYSYEYPYQYADYSIGTITIENNSAEDAYCKLTINGAAENPFWTLIQDGETVLSGRMYSSISSGSYLVIDSDPSAYEIYEYDSYGQKVQDRYEESDFDTERFLYIPPGTSTLRVGHGGSTEISFKVEVTEFAG